MALSDFTPEEKRLVLDEIESDHETTRDWTHELSLLIRDDDAKIRERAVRCLWDCADERFVPVLLTMAERDASTEVRAAALSTLGRFVFEWDMDFEELPPDAAAEYGRVRQALLSARADAARPLPERVSALEAVSFASSDERVAEAILSAYASGEIRWKRAALFSMGRSGHPRWEDTVVKDLDSPVHGIRLEAVRAAGEAGYEGAGERLVRIAQEADRELRLEAIAALGHVGGVAASRTLETLSESADREIASAAEAALWELSAFEQAAEQEERGPDRR